MFEMIYLCAKKKKKKKKEKTTTKNNKKTKQNKIKQLVLDGNTWNHLTMCKLNYSC